MEQKKKKKNLNGDNIDKSKIFRDGLLILEIVVFKSSWWKLETNSINVVSAIDDSSFINVKFIVLNDIKILMDGTNNDFYSQVACCNEVIHTLVKFLSFLFFLTKYCVVCKYRHDYY